MRKKTFLLSIIILIIFSATLSVSVYAMENPYPKSQTLPDGDGKPYNSIPCTYYAWQKVKDVFGIELSAWGNGGQWLDAAIAEGYHTGTIPKVNSLVVWRPTYVDDTGHVAFVTWVSDDASQYTYDEAGTWDRRAEKGTGIYIGHPHPDGYTRDPDGFIYLDTPPANIGDNFYGVILNTECWKPISQVEGSALISLQKENGTSRQLWHFDRQDDGYYVITSCYDGKVLEMHDGERTNGTQLCTHGTFWGGYYQQWKLIPYGDGYMFVSKHYPDEVWVMDLQNNNSSDGTKINIHSRNNSAAQIWSVYKNDDVQLKSPTLTVDAGFDSQKTKFTWNNVYGETQFNIKIWKNKVSGDPDYTKSTTATNYELQLPAGTYQAYVEAVNHFQTKKSNTVTFTVEDISVGHNLVLSGRIGVNFNMTLPASAQTGDAYMEFKISGKDGATTRIKLSEAQKLANGKFRFTCYVNAIQMADEITATYHYGSKSFVDTYSVKEYCEAVVAAASSFDTATVNLIKSIADYGYYSQLAQSEEHGFTVGAGKDHAQMVHYNNVNRNVDMSGFKHSVSGSCPGVTKVTRSLLLDSETQIKIYFTVDNSFSVPSTVKVNGAAAQMTKESDGRYSVIVSGISAHLLGSAYPVQIGSNMTITTSAIAYAKDALANSGVKPSMKDSMASLYQYYVSALAYQKAHP